MSLRSKVKVGNINSLSSARYCAGMGVDFLGFRIGAGGLDPDAYKAIIEWVSGPQLILEAHRDLSLTLEDITHNYPGHYIEINQHQLHWLDSNHEFILHVTQAEWRDVSQRIEGKANLKYIELHVDSLDNLQLPSGLPVILHLGDSDWLDRFAKLPVFALSLTSGGEDKPGLMDYAVVADVLEALEE
jgi:phosphoribosylanthranilate isomerase